MIDRNALLAAIAAFSVSSAGIYGKTSGGNDGSYGQGIPDEPKKVIPKGCKEYTYRGYTVIASSEKSAIKKIDKKFKK